MYKELMYVHGESDTKLIIRVGSDYATSDCIRESLWEEDLDGNVLLTDTDWILYNGATFNQNIENGTYKLIRTRRVDNEGKVV